MKFEELADDKKVDAVKTEYLDLIGEIKMDNKELDKIIPPLTEPKETSSASYEKDMAAFTKNKEDRATIIKTINELQLVADCICEPKELDIDTTKIVPEFEPFIDYARTRAQSRNYV